MLREYLRKVINPQEYVFYIVFFLILAPVGYCMAEIASTQYHRLPIANSIEHRLTKISLLDWPLVEIKSTVDSEEDSASNSFLAKNQAYEKERPISMDEDMGAFIKGIRVVR